MIIFIDLAYVTRLCMIWQEETAYMLVKIGPTARFFFLNMFKNYQEVLVMYSVRLVITLTQCES